MEDIPQLEPPPAPERLAYSIQECADMLGVFFQRLPTHSARQAQGVPSVARQIARATRRAAQVVEYRMRDALDHHRPTHQRRPLLEEQRHTEVFATVLSLVRLTSFG